MKLVTLEKITRAISEQFQLKNGRVTQTEMWASLRTVKAKTKIEAVGEIASLLFFESDEEEIAAKAVEFSR